MKRCLEGDQHIYTHSLCFYRTWPHAPFVTGIITCLGWLLTFLLLCVFVPMHGHDGGGRGGGRDGGSGRGTDLCCWWWLWRLRCWWWSWQLCCWWWSWQPCCWWWSWQPCCWWWSWQLCCWWWLWQLCCWWWLWQLCCWWWLWQLCCWWWLWQLCCWWWLWQLCCWWWLWQLCCWWWSWQPCCWWWSWQLCCWWWLWQLCCWWWLWQLCCWWWSWQLCCWWWSWQLCCWWWLRLRPAAVLLVLWKSAAGGRSLPRCQGSVVAVRVGVCLWVFLWFRLLRWCGLCEAVAMTCMLALWIVEITTGCGFSSLELCCCPWFQRFLLLVSTVCCCRWGDRGMEDESRESGVASSWWFGGVATYSIGITGRWWWSRWRWSCLWCSRFWWLRWWWLCWWWSRWWWSRRWWSRWWWSRWWWSRWWWSRWWWSSWWWPWQWRTWFIPTAMVLAVQRSDSEGRSSSWLLDHLGVLACVISIVPSCSDRAVLEGRPSCRTRTPIRQGGYSRQERPQLYTWIHHFRKRTGGRLQGRVTGEAEVREYGLHSLPSCGVSEAARVPNHLTKRHYGWWSDQVMTTYLRKHCPAWRLCRGRCSQCERVFGCILHPLLCFVCFALLAPGALPAVGVLVALGSLGARGSVMNS